MVQVVVVLVDQLLLVPLVEDQLLVELRLTKDLTNTLDQVNHIQYHQHLDSNMDHKIYIFHQAY